MNPLLLRFLAAAMLALQVNPWAVASAQQVVVVEEPEEADEAGIAEEFADVPILQATPLAAETVDGVLLTVVDVSRPCLDPWAKPPRGNVWICLLITIENLSDEAREYGPGQFTVVTSEQEIARPLLEHDVGDGLQSGWLAPGGALVGTLRFELAEDDNARILRFATAPGRPKEAREIPL